jgi:hypothetical protein
MSFTRYEFTISGGMSSRDQTKEWINSVLQYMQVTPTELARRARLTPSTLTRFVNDPDYPNDLSRRTIDAIASAAGIKPLQKPGERIRSLTDAEATRYSSGDDALVDNLMKAAVGQQNAIDGWVLQSRALELEGYLPGDLLLVSRSEFAVPGDVVQAEIYDWKAGRHENVFRVYEPPYLVSASTDRRARRPMVVDQENVRLIGVVVGTLRPRRILQS